jgi:predicted DNA-binding transcriptional regulator YafY
MTAHKIAEELGVTTRTVYRDVAALSMAGVPVCTESGPGGGISLLGKYSSDLTGLNAAEARAVFMLGAVGPLTQLGLGNELRSALLKLSSALPAGRRAEEEGARNRVFVDSSGWFHEAGPAQLSLTYKAVMQSERLEVTCQTWSGWRVQYCAEPYGLVSKAGRWYLVYKAAGRMRTEPVDQLLEARLTGEKFERDPEWSLVGYWQAYCRAYQDERSQFAVCARVSEAALGLLQAHPDLRRPIEVAQHLQDGRDEVVLYFERLDTARQALLGLGGAVEVVAPTALRKSMIDYARRTVARYE